MVVSLEQPGEYDSEEAKAKALANVQSAFSKHESTVSASSPQVKINVGHISTTRCYNAHNYGNMPLFPNSVSVAIIGSLCCISLQHKTYVDLAGSGGVGGEAKSDLQESCK